MPKKIIILLFIAVLLIYSFTGCENKECISFSTNHIIVSLLDSSGAKKDISFTYIKLLEADMILYSDTSFNTFALPVIPSIDRSSFVFGYDDNFSDTLAVSYVIRQHLISKKCGFELQYNNLMITHSTIPEASVVNDELNILIEKNIEITY